MVALETSPAMLSDLDCIVDRYDDRESWLQGRRSCIGASDTPAILGEGYENQSAATVWHSKVHEAGDDFSPAMLKRLQIGKLMEPALRSIFTQETGLECFSPGEFTLMRHRALPWIGASLDALARDDESGDLFPVELKNVSNFNKAEWEGDEGPLKYAVQLQQQCFVTGASHGFLLGLIGGNEPVVKVIERNDAFIEAMLPKLEEFWGYVERKELPPIDSSAATARILAKLYPRDTGSTAVLPAEAAQWSAAVECAKAIIKEAEAIKHHGENQLKAAIGDATFGDMPRTEPGYVEAVGAEISKAIAGLPWPTLPARYSWKHQARKGFYVEPTEFRVLRGCK